MPKIFRREREDLPSPQADVEGRRERQVLFPAAKRKPVKVRHVLNTTVLLLWYTLLLLYSMHGTRSNLCHYVIFNMHASFRFTLNLWVIHTITSVHIGQYCNKIICANPKLPQNWEKSC